MDDYSIDKIKHNPVFPSPETNNSGLTKREFIATMAMQGLLAGGNTSKHLATNAAVQYADMLIEKLHRDENGD